MSKFENIRNRFCTECTFGKSERYNRTHYEEMFIEHGIYYTDEMLQRTVELIKEDFSHMTVNLVCVCIVQRSMGHFGTGD